MIIQVVTELRGMGYAVELVAGRIKLTWKGEGQPNQAKVTPLLDILRRNKAEAIEMLEADQTRPKPFLDSEGDLVIPYNSDPRYWWWHGGQSISETIRELKNSISHESVTDKR